MSESTPIRKVRHVLAEPHAGRFAVFDWLPQGRRRCRLCGARVRKDNVWDHWEIEAYRVDWNQDAIAERIAFLLRARRSRRNRRHAQYQYATGGEPWKPRKDQIEYVPPGETP